MTEATIKPVALKRGMPAEQHNGLYGLEQTLMDAPTQQVTAVVTFALDDITHKELAGERQPVIKFVHIEPLLDDTAIAAAAALRDAAYKERTGQDQLDIDIDDEGEAEE